MNSQIILDNVNQVVKLDNEETAFLESVLMSRPCKQGELIVKSGDILWLMALVFTKTNNRTAINES